MTALLSVWTIMTCMCGLHYGAAGNAAVASNCGGSAVGHAHSMMYTLYAAPVNDEQLLIDDSSADQPTHAAGVVSSPLTSPWLSIENKNNVSADATAETALLTTSFTVPVPHLPRTPSYHIPILVGRRTPPLMNSRQREVRKHVLIGVEHNSSTVCC